MRSTKIYVAGIIGLILVIFGLQLVLPSRFDWNPSFAHEDKNPFGCYVFDSVMAQTMPRGYQSSGLTLRQVTQDSAKHNVLIIADNLPITKSNVKDIWKLLNRGATVMLVTNYLKDNALIIENFGVDVANWYRFRLDETQSMLSNGENNAYDTIRYDPTSAKKFRKKPSLYGVSTYPTADFHILRSIAGGNVSFTITDAQRYHLTPISYCPSQRIGYDDKGLCRAILCQRGKGRLVVVSTPLLFTNYGVLSASARPYMMRLMNMLAHLPVIRLDGSLGKGSVTGAEADKHNLSPLSYIVSQPPLRWAYYASLIGVLLFMIFTARRRQRIIPIIPAPKNHDMEFVRLIGRLYYEHHDNTDLVMKKWNIMADTLRNQLDVDLTDNRQLQDNIAEVATATGIDKPTIALLVAEVSNIRDNSLQVSDANMMRLIAQMDDIIKNL